MPARRAVSRVSADSAIVQPFDMRPVEAGMGAVEQQQPARTCRAMSVAFASSDMGLSGHARPAKPGVALMWSMREVQAA